MSRLRAFSRWINLLAVLSLLLGVMPVPARADRASLVDVETGASAEPTPEAERLGAGFQAKTAEFTIYLPVVLSNYVYVAEAAPATLDQYAEPWLVLPGDVTTYTLVVQNPGGDALLSGELTAETPEMVEPVAGGVSHGGVYSAQARRVRWSLPEVAGGASLTVTFRAQVMANAAVTATSMAYLTGTLGNGHVFTDSDPTYLSVGEAQTQTLTSAGGALISPGGSMTLTAPAGAVAQTTEVRVTSFPVPFEVGDIPTRWQLFFDVTAVGAAGAALRDEAGHTRFLQPLTATIDVEHTWEQPFLVHMTASADENFIMPLEHDPDTGLSMVALQTFSAYGVGGADPYAAEGAYHLMTNQPGTGMFNGAATYSYPLDVPAGRRGLTPKLSLNYSSSGMNSLLGIVQSGEVGMGWNLGGQVQIVRPVKTFIQCSDRTCRAFWWSSNAFDLTINGTSYNLEGYTKDPAGGCRYDATDGPGLRVMRYTIPGDGGKYCGYPAGVTKDSVPNESKEYWEVTTGDGTIYRLGYTQNSEQLMRMQYYGPTYPCDDLNTCAWNYWYRFDGYAGELEKRVVHRWSVDLVRDVYGNEMTYGYHEEQRPFHSDLDYTYDRGQHLEWIRYGGNSTQGIPGMYLVDVAVEPRTNVNDDGGGTWHDAGPEHNYDFGVLVEDWSMWDEMRLDRVRVCLNPSGDTCADGTLLSEYDLDYEFAVENSEKRIETTRLQSLTRSAPNENGVMVALPATTFGYVSLSQRRPTQVNYYDLPYPRLATVNNGYGGVTTFEYEEVAQGYVHKSFYGDYHHIYKSYRVKTQTTNDGLGHTSTVAYTYENPCFNFELGRPWSCAFPGSGPDFSLTGHSMVKQEVKGYAGETLAVTAHHFHREHDEQWRMGREYQAVAYAVDGATPLQQTDTQWVHEDVNSATFTYARIVTATDYTGGTPLATWKEYRYDPAYQGEKQHGLLTHMIEYDVQNVRQRINFTFYVVDENKWLLLPWAQDVFDGKWVWKNTKFYLYDGNMDPNTQMLSKGALTLERSLVIDAAVCPTTDRTVDISYQYDAYGNVVTTTTYSDYGRMYCADNSGNWDPVGAPGNGSTSYVSVVSYDSSYHMFPVQSCSAVGTLEQQCSGVEYYGVNGNAEICAAGEGYFFGSVCREWGPNGASTATHYHYDAFGRKTKAWLPGEDVTTSHPSQQIQYFDVTHPEWKPTVVAIWNRYADNSSFYDEGTALWQRVFYDGLGRTIQQHSRTADWTDEGGGSDIVQYTQYDGLGRAVVQSTPYITTPYIYNSANPQNPYKSPDQGQPQTRTEYDALGRVVRVVNPDDTAATAQYAGRATTTVDANGHQVRQTMDDLGRMVEVEEFTGTVSAGVAVYATTRYAYDTLNNLTAVTDTVGNVTTMQYDGLGRKVAMDDPDMGDWSYIYNSTGTLQRQTDARGCTVVFYHDALSRVIEKHYEGTAGCAQPPVSYTYDNGLYGRGLRTGMTYSGGKSTYAYDVRGRLVRTTQELAKTFTTSYTYDDLDRPMSITYPDGEVVTTHYDNAGYPVTLTGQSATYVSGVSYNALGSPTEMLMGNGTVTRWGYKGMDGMWDRTGTVHPYYQYGQLWRTRVSDASGNPLFDQALNYDNVGNVTSLKEAPLSVENWPLTGTATFADTFNTWKAGWVTTTHHSLALEGNNAVLRNSGPGTRQETLLSRSEYNLSAGEGVQLRFKVDDANAIAHFTLVADSVDEMRFGAVVNGGKLFVQYMDEAEPGVYRNPADLLTEFELNTWYVLRLAISDTPGLYVEVYKEGEPGKRSSYNLWMATGLNWQFRHWIRSGNAYLDDYYEFSTAGVSWKDAMHANLTYDPLNRLTGMQQGYVADYQYDAIGNLTYKREGTSTWTRYDYVAGSVRPHAVVSLSDGSSFEYDANGNMIERAVATGGSPLIYTQRYDAENRLVVVTRTVDAVSQVTRFLYDGDGTRIAQVTEEGTTVYVGEIYEECSASSVVTATKYYYLGSQRVAMRSSDELLYLHGDHLGSTSLTTDAAGQVVSRQRYYPFGGVRVQEGDSPTDFGFTGQRLDDRTGLMYYKARYYSAGLGRFVQADTVVPDPGNPQSLNRYAYVLNNPFKYTDPTGNFEEDEIDRYLEFQMGIENANERQKIIQEWKGNGEWWAVIGPGGAKYWDKLDGLEMAFFTSWECGGTLGRDEEHNTFTFESFSLFDADLNLQEFYENAQDVLWLRPNGYNPQSGNLSYLHMGGTGYGAIGAEIDWKAARDAFLDTAGTLSFGFTTIGLLVAPDPTLVTKGLAVGTGLLTVGSFTVAMEDSRKFGRSLMTALRIAVFTQ